MKYILVFLLFMAPGIVWAGNYHSTVINYSTTVVSGEDDRNNRGTAIAMCLSGAQFDYAKGWQGSAAGAWWRDEQAVCGAFAKRIEDILFSGGIGCDTDFDDCGGAIAGSWHF